MALTKSARQLLERMQSAADGAASISASGTHVVVRIAESDAAVFDVLADEIVSRMDLPPARVTDEMVDKAMQHRWHDLAQICSCGRRFGTLHDFTKHVLKAALED